MGSSPSRGIQSIFSEEYVEREKRKKMPRYLYVRSLSLPHLYFSFIIYIFEYIYIKIIDQESQNFMLFATIDRTTAVPDDRTTAVPDDRTTAVCETISSKKHEILTFLIYYFILLRFGQLSTLYR